ncbi:MAG: energy transducer TonB [Gemmatimonadales bacterium]
MSDPDERQLLAVAYERFKRHLTDWIAIGVILSVGVHYALFTLFPTLRAADLSFGSGEITAVALPPVVNVPPPPHQIARPETPRVGTADIKEDVTIAPTTFEANPTQNLAPPPRPARAAPKEDRPRFIPYDTPPRLLNPEEIRALLERGYPAELREARVEGKVVIWAYVDIEGKVGTAHVQQSSGFAAMDRAALDVARKMEFSPALNRDKKTAVWVQQSIVFQTK